MAKLLVVLCALVAAASARPGFLHGALPYSTIAYAAAPVALTSQYHAQDALGQYSYGYSGGLSAKSESRGVDGSVAGGYSYVDEKGELQSVRYTADAAHGFRVAASNLPVAPAAPEAPALEAPKPVEDTPEVAEAKAAHAAAVAEAAAKAAAAPEVPEPAPAPVTYSAPAVVAVSPAHSFAYSTVAAAPFGHLAYGYHAVAAPAVSYSAPVAVAGPAPANIVINDKGVPEYTPEVAAARAADAIAHLQAKARIFG